MTLVILMIGIADEVSEETHENGSWMILLNDNEVSLLQGVVEDCV